MTDPIVNDILSAVLANKINGAGLRVSASIMFDGVRCNTGQLTVIR